MSIFRGLSLFAVAFFKKHVAAPVAAIGDRVGKTGNNNPRKPGHGGILPKGGSGGKRKVSCPRNNREVLISQIVFDEIEQASELKRDRMKVLIETISPKRILTTESALFLAREYIRAGVLSDRHRNDCLHVAVATVAECDFLLSWNFRHLANIRRAARFLAVNILHGYNQELTICNPLEVYEI